MNTHAQTASWYDTMMTYSLLHSDYPTIVRYISGAFIALGFCFFGPILLLIGVDIVIYIYRICWSRPWNQNQNQTSLREPRHLLQPQKAQPPPPPLGASGGTTAVPSTVTSECEVMIKGLCFERKVFARD
ncbi:hypothetical protein JMJ77_0009571 [Colletotrichum scovillei]|uniref:Uncharacterized protein n=1 Tax=Colletotrichum scovillei TaxID=1209932 RepID=A0A9P7UBV5_9PEZI|nr:hypothetical protein JMJ77_0009571 [Colletotrichum scovillei]KAG7052651.1 hypothetical protein JMJ78_0005666 [Colletotrichum scovillei]KAG7064943.1 hypothetical protein JMJ76_0012699 [Colletotrichum scovillei]